jgi:hypothetical protein
MPLLDRTKPNATRESVIRHAVIWAVVSAVAYPIAAHWRPWLWEIWPVGLPLAILGGAALGALMQGQLDD